MRTLIMLTVLIGLSARRAKFRQEMHREPRGRRFCSKTSCPNGMRQTNATTLGIDQDLEVRPCCGKAFSERCAATKKTTHAATKQPIKLATRSQPVLT